MPNDQLDNRIDEIERELCRDDPAFGERFERLDGHHPRRDLAVFALLALSAVLFAVGVATMSPIAWAVGIAGYLSSFALDTRFDRRRDARTRIDHTDQIRRWR